MFKTKFAQQSVKRIGSGLVATAIGLATCLAPAIAKADITVGPAGWLLLSGPKLRVVVSGQEFFAYSSAAPVGCPSIDPETVKQYHSLAQASLLSGKRIGVHWFTCGNSSIKYMYAMELTA